MTLPLQLARLNAPRALAAMLEARAGAGLGLAGPIGPVEFTKPSTDSAARMLVRHLDENPTAATDFEHAVRAAPLGRSTRLPYGLVGMVLAVELPDGPGRLVTAPFVANERERRAIAETWRGLGAKPAAADRFARALTVLDAGNEAWARAILEATRSEVHAYAAAVARSLRRESVAGDGPFPDILGKSAAMRTLFAAMERIAPSEGTVYILGENGTGKELVASQLHAHSRRRDRPFVAQNCSALNDNLLESELFGHRRGAFTGATADKPGLFSLAHTGTFFLDEVGDMSPALQVKLLRVLQEGTFTPVGDTGVTRVDVRVICATHRDLEKLASEGGFRNDLFYRLNVLPLRVPALRERAEDIPLLVDAFLARAQRELGEPDGRRRFTAEAMAALLAYPWPGNVRELENEVSRVVVMSGPFVSRIGVDALSPHIMKRRATPTTSARVAGESLPSAIERMERAWISDTLQATRGNKSRAAALLGVSRRNLIRKCQELGFDARRPSAEPVPSKSPSGSEEE